MKVIYRSLLSVLCLALLSAAPALAGDVNVSAAASLKEVINELSASFAKTHPGVKFLKNFGGSGTLAKQVENGAPADIFISANLEWVDYLKGKGALDNRSIIPFTYNALVFAGIPGKPVAGMKDLVKLDKIAIGSPKSVPAGEYATEALKKAGMEAALKDKLVMAKDVRECLMYAERGEVDGAFVYRSDAQEAKRAKILFTVPEHLHARIVYPMALTMSGAKNRDAEAFLNYLKGKDAKAVLVKYGFSEK